MVTRPYYVLTERIGAGGFGAVWAATYHGIGSLQTEVALKVYHAGAPGSEELATRLRDEGRVLGFLLHRNIVVVRRIVVVNGQHALEMERIRGCDLGRLVQTGTLPPPRAALQIVSEAASALDFAWSATDREGRPLRVLHRDIKPSNIALTADGDVKVLDFGIAKAELAVRESRTNADTVPGTMDFMASERFEGREGPEADVYSLGGVLFALLAGRHFGRGRASAAAHERVLVGACNELLEMLDGAWGAGTTAPILDLLYRTLHFDPAERPTAAELHHAAHALAETAPGPTLRAWAHETVPALRAAHPPRPSPDDGRMLEEQSERSIALVPAQPFSQAIGVPPVAPTMPDDQGSQDPGLEPIALSRSVRHEQPFPETPPDFVSVAAEARALEAPRGSRSPLWTLAGVVLGAVVVVAVGLVLVLKAARPPASEASPPPVASVAVAAEPEAAPPPPPAQAPAPTLARVRLDGDAHTARLQASGTSYGLPASVPAGVYEVVADFGDGASVVGDVTVPSRGSILVRCTSAMMVCEVASR